MDTLAKIYSGPSTFMHTFNFLVKNLVHIPIINLPFSTFKMYFNTTSVTKSVLIIQNQA